MEKLLKYKLALGSSSRFYGDDWDHIDSGMFLDQKHLIMNFDIFNLPYDSDSVDLIYASHLIAYFNIDEAAGLLKEWRRVLKPNGILRIATPDFTMISSVLRSNYFGDFEMKDIIGPLYGRMKMGGKEIYHKYCYDWRSLKKLMVSCGLRDVKTYDWRKTEHSHIDDHSRAHLPHDSEAIKSGIFTGDHLPISLNMEAIK